MMKDKYSKNSGGFLPKNVCDLCCLLLLWLMSSLVGHTAEIGGPISTNTTWAVADSPFQLTSSVLVAEGITLTIEAGCVINIGNDLGIQVSGALIARGATSQPIVFQSTSGTTPGSWGSISFSDSSIDVVLTNGSYSSGSVLQYCHIKYGGGGGGSGMVSITNANPLIDNCQIQHAATTGIYIDSANDLLIKSCLISDNSKTVVSSGDWGVMGGGLYLKNTVASLIGNTIRGNSATRNSQNDVYGGGVYLSGGTNTLTGNIISDNYVTSSERAFGGGLHLGEGTNTLIGNIISDNYVTTTYYGQAYGGGLYLESGTYILTGNTVSGNSVTAVRHGAQGGGLYLSGGTYILTDNTVSGNSVATGEEDRPDRGAYGGGIYGQGLQTFDLNNNIITTNTERHNVSRENKKRKEKEPE